MQKIPVTKAYLKIHSQDFTNQQMDGEVSAGDFHWQFHWQFSKNQLTVSPPLGRALIQDALLRFLIKADYSLELGQDYIFTVRARF